MSTVRRRVLAILGLVVVVTLVMGAPAAARTWFVRDVTPPSESSKLLAPGTSFTRTVEIHNRFHGNAQLYVRATNLEDDDNGCVQPETESGDNTCGAGGGELSPWLHISIRTVPRDGEPVEVWSGSLTELTEGDALLVHRLPKGSTNLLELVTTMSVDADNTTMTDRVDYDLEWTMTQGIGNQVDVLGMESRTDPPGSPALTLASAAQSLRDPELLAALLLGLAALMVPLRLVRTRLHR
jgi:hypothetical protein